MRHSFLLIALTVSAIVACGGAASQPATPEAHHDHREEVAADGGAAATPAKGPGTPNIQASAMAGDLQAIGLDPKNLPELQKLEPEKLRKVMKLFSRSLGVRCNDCHKDDDFKAPTPMKKVATRMWNEWVRGLAFEDGSLLFCDSCHQGKKEMLDKSNHKELARWMESNLVAKLHRTDKKDHSCGTCHGDPFDGDFLDNWKK